MMKNKEGFTIIEILVVVAISAILSAVVIGYSTVSKNDVAVSVETAKIYQTIFQAKTLAIATYANSSSSCGYGVSFNYSAGTYSIFIYNPSGAPPCPESAAVASNNDIAPSEMVPYSASTWRVSVVKGVALKQKGDSVAFVLFYPPDPTTFISRDGTSFTDASEPSSNIYLAPVGNASATEVISVNSVGQITTL